MKFKDENHKKRVEYMRAWRARNAEKCRIYDREYYRSKMPMWRKIKKWASLKKFFAANPLYSKEYYESHKPEANARVYKRRAHLLAQIHPDADMQAIAEIYTECFATSIETGIRHHVDHIIPLAKGGWHHQDNLQLLPENINISKADDAFWSVEGYSSWKNVPSNLWPQQLVEQYNSMISSQEK